MERNRTRRREDAKKAQERKRPAFSAPLRLCASTVRSCGAQMPVLEIPPHVQPVEIGVGIPHGLSVASPAHPYENVHPDPKLSHNAFPGPA
jgi:hypothetical protein